MRRDATTNNNATTIHIELIPFRLKSISGIRVLVPEHEPRGAGTGSESVGEYFSRNEVATEHRKRPIRSVPRYDAGGYAPANILSRLYVLQTIGFRRLGVTRPHL